MIVKVLMNIVVNSLCAILQGLEIVSLPVNMIEALSTVLKYGTYIVGNDLLLVVFSSIMGWLTIRTVLGFALFVWRLLPLT